MTLVSQIDFQPLLESYIFANTPRYLYQHFKSNASLKELAQRNSVEDLISEYNNRINKDETSVEDVVIAYALLIAFTYLDYQQALEAFAAVDLSKLDWGSEVKDIFVSVFTPTSIYNLAVEAKPEFFASQQSTSKSNSAATQKSIQPKDQSRPTVKIVEG